MLELADVTLADLERIDGEWPPLRPKKDLTYSWRWRELVDGEKETFLLKKEDGTPVAIWVSRRRKPIVLGGKLYYRLDNIEVHPTHRGARLGRILGILLMAVIAQRALEVGATGLVLATWDTHADFYGKAGGVQVAPRGWTVATGLIPFTFDERALSRLKEMADEFIAD